MRNKTNSIWMIATAMLLVAGFTACSNEALSEGDEITNGNVQDLPEGKYPLAISSVTMAWPGSADAPQTRMVENAAGSQSQWETDDEIRVGIGGQTDSQNYKLTVAEGGTVTAIAPSGTPVYWKNKEAKKVRGWYPANGVVALDNQTQKLAYALFAETATAVNYETKDISLPFQHQLAKIRVVPDGNMKDEVTDVKIRTYQSCTLNEDGTLSTDGATEDFISMMLVTRNGVKCWEANVVPGYNIEQVMVSLNSGGISQFQLSTPVTPVAGKWHEVSVSVDKVVNLTTITDDTYTVDDNVSIIIDGKGQSLSKKLVIGAGATVVLKDVILEPIPTYNDEINTVTCNSNATIKLSGTNLIKGARGRNAGYPGGYAILINGGTLTIEGPGTLTAIGVGYEGAGIGAINGANIVINGGIITASSSNPVMPSDGAPGIGSGDGAGIYENRYCGNITINGGNITAQGGGGSAGIGAGFFGKCGDIVITGKSTVVNATKGANYFPIDDIGKGQDGECGSIKYSGGATVNGTKYE